MIQKTTGVLRLDQDFNPDHFDIDLVNRVLSHLLFDESVANEIGKLKSDYILIIANSARMLAQSAKSGLKPLVIDLYADLDTQEHSVAYQQIPDQAQSIWLLPWIILLKTMPSPNWFMAAVLNSIQIVVVFANPLNPVRK